MDDKAYTDTDANNETAPVVPPGAIEITATGTSDSSKFTGSYFVPVVNAGPPVTTTYTLYSKNGVVFASGLTSGTGFGFDHDAQKGSAPPPPPPKIHWTITNFLVVTANGITTITGNWSNNDPDIAGGPQSGSFQGSSSGTIDPVATSASA